MIKETKTLKEITIKQKYCDVCGVEIKRGLACSVAKCIMCNKDLCEKCVGKENDTFGDYRKVFCEKCWVIGESYRKTIDEYEKMIYKLHKDWLKQCVTS